MMVSLRVVAVTLVFCLHQTSACSCLRPTMEQILCHGHSSKVFKAHVHSVEEFPTERMKIFQVEVEEIFKDEAGIMTSGSRVEVHTNNSGAMCGFDMEVSGVYLIDANYRRGDLWVNLCSASRQWPDGDTASASFVQHIRSINCERTVVR